MGKTPRQAWICISYKFLYFLLISCNNRNKLTCIIRHTSHQCFYSSNTVGIFLSWRVHWNQIISLINKQYTAHSFIHRLVHIDTCRISITIEQSLAFTFHDMTFRENTHSSEHLSQTFGNHRLTSSRVTSYCYMDIGKRGISCSHFYTSSFIPYFFSNRLQLFLDLVHTNDVIQRSQHLINTKNLTCLLPFNIIHCDDSLLTLMITSVFPCLDHT